MRRPRPSARRAEPGTNAYGGNQVTCLGGSQVGLLADLKET